MRKVAWSAFTSVFVLAVANAYALDSLYSRNLSCSRFSAARERQICEALEREMEWTWSGHAIIAPSFRVTFATVKKGLLRSFRNRARYAFTGQDGRADRAEDGWHDGGHAASKRRPISALCAWQTSLECISGAAK